ncbi:MAG: alpha/beta hydrolase [Clostridiales bacterium]|nr:alpha/beta hydrolase [Clostridiales bacterium]
MASIRARMVGGLFKLMGVNKMLDKQGPEFDKLLETYKEKQKKPLKVPYSKMKDFDLETKVIDRTTCYTIVKKGAAPKVGVLYLFGGGYILPPDPGDIILCGQIAENCNAKVWFPLYPMAPEHRLVETLQSSLKVYKDILSEFDSSAVRFFGTSSGGGQAMSLCVYIKNEVADVPLPGKLVLQSPGLQVPPSPAQKLEMEERAKDDVMIPPRFFDNIAPVLAQGDEAYLLSPLLCDLKGFPSLDVFYGTKEVMMAYVRDLKDVCKRDGVSLGLHIGQDMMHCWGAMEFVPEAKAVRREYFKALK